MRGPAARAARRIERPVAPIQARLRQRRRHRIKVYQSVHTPDYRPGGLHLYRDAGAKIRDEKRGPIT